MSDAENLTSDADDPVATGITGDAGGAGLSAYSGHGFNPSGANDSWSNLYLHVPPNSRVLDVGCSSGNFGEALERLKGCTVTGVDLDAADVAEAATKISRALVFDITTAPTLDGLGLFDVVVFADVLEHLGDPREALRRIRSLLAEGGFVVFSIPNMTHASVRIDLLRGEFGYTQTGILDKTHVHFYDRAEVDDIFASSGFTVVDENPVVFPYPDAMLETELGSLGLRVDESDPTFFDLLAKTDASVLQFVGKAVPDARASAPHTRQREFPPEEINRVVADLVARADTAEAAQVELQAQTDAATVDLATARADVAAAVSRAEAERERADTERARADAEQTRADAAQAEVDRISAIIAELKHNPLRFAAKRLRRP
ncbi:class I SAM-dependent methyltransferase [Subtercola boreus]|uniref:Methyltransferase type 11 domain-containing protein n=1 Tax=Subtercola boreus TaxID=120213 RepID=A0A3E0W941_9MICO|nr:class I SAM-dependent methyltransferase [Subtercola boreus]RFA20019.1 hypothetical protein B7R24_10575 [Subtercola boreus]RFA20148.1 hypothetical protein B7R23_10515 [Subtercola boreus]RFA26475.1 hypothetical protein B7R25_10640 [Subtercola boreus]